MSIVIAYVDTNNKPVIVAPGKGIDIHTLQKNYPNSEQISTELIEAIKKEHLTQTSKTTISIAEFKKRLIPILLTLSGKSEGLQRKWDRCINILDRLESINPDDLTIKYILAQAVGDGLLNQGDANNLLRIT